MKKLLFLLLPAVSMSNIHGNIDLGYTYSTEGQILSRGIIKNQFVKEYTYSLPTGSLNIYSNYVDLNLRSTDKFTSSLKLKSPTLKSSLTTSVKTNEYKDKLKTKMDSLSFSYNYDSLLTLGYQKNFGNYNIYQSYVKKYNSFSGSSDGHNHDSENKLIHPNQIAEKINSTANLKENTYTAKLNYKPTEDISLSLNGKYNKIDFDIKDYVSIDLNTYTLGASINKQYYFDSLRLSLGSNAKYEKKNIKYTELKPEEDKYLENKPEIITNYGYTAHTTKSIGVSANLSYVHDFTDKFYVQTGLNTNLTLSQKRATVDEQFLEQRKNAYEEDVKQANKKREKLIQEKGENYIKEQEEKIKNAKVSINIQEAIDEKAKTITRRQKPSDFDERKNKFKKLAEGKSYDEITEFVASKKSEYNKYTMEQKIRLKPYQDLETTKKELSNKTKDEAVITKIMDLFEYSPQGVYSQLNSGIIDKFFQKTRELKINQYEFKGIYPDKFIAENYFKLYEATKNNYEIDIELNPFVKANYMFTPNLKAYASIDMIVELNKKLKKDSKMTHHIHFTPKVGFNYTF